MILRHTLKVLKDVANYLLENLNFDFVLYDKFQTDHLESQFGQYRQMCGGNRLVSVQEIEESKRKLKINSLLRLHSPSFTILVKKYLLEFSDSVESTTLLKGDQNFIEEFPYNQVAFDETQLPVLLYVAGYAVKKVTSKLSCGGYKQLLFDESGELLQVEIDNSVLTYFQELNRGGLTYPSTILLRVFQAAHALFIICISKNYEKVFIRLNNQKVVLTKILKEYTEFVDAFMMSEDCNLCLNSNSIILLKCASVSFNIMLNNNVKYFAVITKKATKF